MPDRLMAQIEVPPPPPATAERLALMGKQRSISQAAKEGGPKDNPAQKELRRLALQDAQNWIWRPVTSEGGFAERLVSVWANRLTVAQRSAPLRNLVGPYIDDVIRPHIAGRFADMLAASAWHPAMMIFLDQAGSIGPNSVIGKRRRRGLNENFAREFLELHSMGRGYSQADVTALAGLFAGMNWDYDGTSFDEGRAEPGPHTVLGQRFESGPEGIAALIETVALRPETAESVARRLAVHFIADDPPADLIGAMAAAYLEGGSALRPVYRVLVSHPAAAAPLGAKLRSPQDYVAASIRALGLGPEWAAEGKARLKTREALAAMGQPTFHAPGPDGWPETTEGWITAPTLSARITWAETLARRFGENSDPAAVAARILGGQDDGTAIAVAQAEQRWEGLAVLLASPAFMRR